MSKVSFRNTDLTRVTFNDKATWGKGEDDESKFKVIEERSLETYLEYSLTWKKITTSGSKDNDIFIDLLKQIGVKWKGQLQFKNGENQYGHKSISLKL
jgi:hypothetical protein